MSEATTAQAIDVHREGKTHLRLTPYQLPSRVPAPVAWIKPDNRPILRGIPPFSIRGLPHPTPVGPRSDPTALRYREHVDEKGIRDASLEIVLSVPDMDELRPLLLGSGSPRRSKILRTLRIPTVAVARAPIETPRSNERAEEFLERDAGEARVGSRISLLSITHPPVLVADTIVLVDNEISRQAPHHPMPSRWPNSSPGASRIWTRFVLAAGDRPTSRCTRRRFVIVCSLKPERPEFGATRSCGEGLDKAGAYAGAGTRIVREVQTPIEAPTGAWSGLPACEVVAGDALDTTSARYPLP